MENKQELKSMVPYLPVGMRGSSLIWPLQAIETLRQLGTGRVNSAQKLLRFITELRKGLSRTSKPLATSASNGYSLFFDQIMSAEQSREWFKVVLPALGNLLLRFPSLLQSHYEKDNENTSTYNNVVNDGTVVTTALRLLESQQPGIVFLSQELIAAILACSLFCLFPVNNRSAKHLPLINFERLFVLLCGDHNKKIENKIWCIVHYFKRISSKMPKGVVSFERKVLPFNNDSVHISYPNDNFWSTSAIPLCKFEVHSSGLIEDQSGEAVEVDFADKSFGGLIIGMGCVQEEIRFLVNPELIAGMLFLPVMAENEAIEIVGVERFSSYTGYSSSFRFSGDYVDKREVDALGRRKTRIVAIDALNRAKTRQYQANFVLREINKAFCGFLYQCKYQLYQKLLQEDGCSSALVDAATSTSEGKTSDHKIRNSQNDCHRMDHGNNMGIATGNWGCGVFGGDPEVKSIIQWLAASQALRPFTSYYTFRLKSLQNIDQVVHLILSHKWTVGDLWKIVSEYSASRSRGETKIGFFQWLRSSKYAKS